MKNKKNNKEGVEDLENEVEGLQSKVDTLIDQIDEFGPQKRQREPSQEKTQYTPKSSITPSQIGEAISNTIQRSKENVKKLKEMKNSLLSRIKQVKKAITTHLNQYDNLENDITKLRQDMKSRINPLYQRIKNFEKNTLQQFQEELQTQKKTIQHFQNTYVTEEERKQQEKTLQKLEENIQALNDKYQKLSQSIDQQLPQLQDALKQQKKKLKKRLSQFEETVTFFLAFPSGVSTIRASRSKKVASLLDEIHQQVTTGQNVPPSIQQKTNFRKIRGISFEYNGKRLESKKDQEIGTIIDSMPIQVIHVRPYWDYEDLGGNSQITIDYENGDKTRMNVPGNTTIDQLKQEIIERVLNSGEGLKPSAKKRWEQDLRGGSLGRIENFEIIGNGGRIEDPHTTISELQLGASKEVTFMVSFSYL